MRVDLEGSVEALPLPAIGGEAVRRLSADGARAALVLESGQLWVGSAGSADDARFERVAPGVVVAEAVVIGAGLWVRTSSGALLASSDGGRTLARCPVPGNAVVLAHDRGQGGIAALVTDDARQPLALVRGTADGTVVRQPLEDAGAVGVPGLFAARAGSLAYVARTGRIVRRRPGKGAESFDWEGKITALSFVDDSGTLLAAAYSEADEATALVRIDAAGRPAIVARLGAAVEAPDSDGRVAAIACDDSRGVVWVAGGFGVAAFAVAAE
jgi:hypothetical protein